MTQVRALSCAIMIGCLLQMPAQILAQGRTDALVVSIQGVDDLAFPLASAAFTVDQGGQPVRDIVPEEVRVEESGAPTTEVSIRRAIDASIPLALVVVIDVSGSMSGETLAKAQSSAKSLLTSLKSVDRAAVLSFGNEVRIDQSLSPDRSALKSAIDRLRADGSTALYDGVVLATDVAAASRFTRRAIVLLSDGRESGDASRLSREASLATAEEAGSPFYVVGVGDEIDREYLAQLATSTGGRYFEAAGPAQVPNIYTSVEELLRGQFIASFRAASPAEQQDRSITIIVNRAGLTGFAHRTYTSLRLSPAAGPAGHAAPEQPDDDANIDQPAPSLPAVLILSAAFLPTLAAVGVLVRRRMRSNAGGSDPEDLDQPEPPPETDDATPLDVRRWSSLILVTGPGPEADRTLALDGEPVTLGSAASCGLRLREDPAVSPEHVRLWTRERKLMLHHLAPDQSTTIEGKSIVWAALEDGAQFEVGPYVFRWRAPSEERDELDGVTTSD